MITFLESPTQICLFTIQPTTIKGRLLSSRPMLKPFSGENILSPVEMGPKNGRLGILAVEENNLTTPENTKH